MEQLKRYAIFAAVVEAGSMTGAAKARHDPLRRQSAYQPAGEPARPHPAAPLHPPPQPDRGGEVVWQGCQSLQQTLNQTELRLSEVRDSLLGRCGSPPR